MAGIKIVNLPALGRNLASTDLFELSLAGGTGSRKITGQEIINGIPLPPSGLTIGTTAITSGTVGRVLFEGTGNVVQESAGLTYNDTTKAFTLSGNLNSGISYTTENTSTGVSASAGFAVKNNLGVIGGLTAFSSLHGVVLLRSNVVLASGPSASNVILATAFDVASGGTGSIQLATGGYSGNPTKMTVFGNTGNVLIQNGGTHTDAGYKLDVNGTARVATSLEIINTGGITFGGGATALSYAGGGQLHLGNSATWSDLRLYASAVVKFSQTSSLTTITNTTINLSTATVQLAGVSALAYSGADVRIGSITAGFTSLSFYTAASEKMRIAATTGNVLINTTTDAGYKLDVNGTFRATVSTETNPFVIAHTNGNYATILIGNGSQLAAGQMGMYFNGTPVWSWNGSTFRLPGNLLSTSSNASTLQLIGGWGGSTVGTSIRLASNTGNGGVFTATSGTQSTVEIGNAGNETWSPSSGNATYNLLNVIPRFNTTGTYSGIARGFYYNPTLTSTTGLTHFAFHSTSGRVRFEGLPTSPTGLNAGDLYNNLGVLMIV